MDGERKYEGRGTYVCCAQSCIQKAFKSPKRINSLLRVQLTSEAIAQFERVLLEYTKEIRESNAQKEELS